MFLSDRDLKWAIETKRLVVDPPPEKIDPTSIDLHLGPISDAKVWDIEKFTTDGSASGRERPELYIGKYKLGDFGDKYLINPPPIENRTDSNLVYSKGPEVVVRSGGFLLWMTREIVGTPEENAEYICFVNGKSSKARVGLVVHMTAPTIHSAWKGKVVLEIANLGPFDLVFQEGDAVAQLTVSRITSAPDRAISKPFSTLGQSTAHGRKKHRVPIPPPSDTHRWLPRNL